MASAMTVGDLGGLWRRSLLARPEGERDTTTWVNWLQGPSFFIDLRQPAGRPDFRGVTCLDGLVLSEIEWLATQEAFAGRLQQRADYFEWHREVDFQVKAPHPDQGLLRFEDGMMVEDDRHGRYIEHWHREDAGAACALRFVDRLSACAGFLMRLRSLFMYARGRSAQHAATRTLHECLQDASNLKAAQDLIDCEISQGVVSAAGWVIQRSTLPFKEGVALDPSIVRGRSQTLTIADLSRDGRPMRRIVDITESEGPLDRFRLADGPSHPVMTREMT
jgi:hypothetical protein